jgi:hypothetical protein
MDGGLVLHPLDREELSNPLDRAADQAAHQYVVETLFEDDDGVVMRPVL